MTMALALTMNCFDLNPNLKDQDLFSGQSQSHCSRQARFRLIRSLPPTIYCFFSQQNPPLVLSIPPIDPLVKTF
jgi:hypothetical protein